MNVTVNGFERPYSSSDSQSQYCHAFPFSRHPQPKLPPHHISRFRQPCLVAPVIADWCTQDDSHTRTLRATRPYVPPDVFVFSLTSVRCPVALCAPYCERVRIHSHNGRYRGIAPRAERHPARHCRLSGVRSPVAVSYRHMYATGVVHTVLGWYAVRARSVISYSTTIRPSTAYNVLQYLHEDRRPGDPTPGVIPQCSEAENGSITLRSGGFVYSSGCRQQGHRFARTVHWSKHST